MDLYIQDNFANQTIKSTVMESNLGQTDKNTTACIMLELERETVSLQQLTGIFTKANFKKMWLMVKEYLLELMA